MIRFVDLTQAYWSFPEDPENPPAPVCAFLDTVTDRFITVIPEDPKARPPHVCHDMDDVETFGERCMTMVPANFFAPKR